MKRLTQDQWELFGINLAAPLSAWWRILSGSIKPEWKEAFLRPALRISASVSQKDVTFSLETQNNKKVIECLELGALKNQPDGLVLKEIGRWQSVSPKELSFEVRVENQAILSREVELPVQAENDLKQAVGFQLDQFTPFDPKEIYYDVRIKNRNRATQSILVEVWVLPKATVSAHLQDLVRVVGLPLDRIAVIGGPDTVNLLEKSKTRFRPNNNFWWAICMILFAGVALSSPLIKKRSHLIEQRGQIEILRSEAAGITEKKQVLEKGLEELKFLLDKKFEVPPLAQVVNELSRTIPDEVYVSQLSFRGRKITLKGQGQNVVSLVEKLQASPVIDAANFSATVNRNAMTGLDSFSMEIVLAGRIQQQ